MSLGLADDFIHLDRTFHELVQDETVGDDTDLSRIARDGKSLGWDDLLSMPRVVLLSEAGSGKTAEARHACRKLRREGKRAFFIRIEHVVQSFEDAFEEGDHDEFKAWIAEGGEGWLLLDSVDEARLKDPKDFERAIRKLKRELAPVLPRAHIIMTGRAVAWRPKTDLLLVREAFPFVPPAEEADSLAKKAGSSDNEDEAGKSTDGFRIVALDDLKGEQVDRFAAGMGVTDLAAFRTAVDRKDAWTLTTRPMDLAELCGFWIDNGKIASRLELMKASIDRRLEEIDQNRADARPITLEKLRRGARLVAAAATLTQKSALRIPDGANNTRGLPLKPVLPDWDDVEISVLLSRPIFDEGIYGTVRFHHRSVREFLTAEWLHGLIVDQASRSRIESLFFRQQYGVEVIVPTMRPLLPWLCLLDDRILRRTTELAPEILFEGGDPSQLPRETRVEILRQTCELIAQPAHGRSMMDLAAVQRFAHRDIADEIQALLQSHANDGDIVAFLLRMIWVGELEELADEATRQAVALKDHYPRLSAIRAVLAVGSTGQIESVREAVVASGQEAQRDWVGEFIAELGVTPNEANWLLRALERVRPPERFSADRLSHALPDYVARLPIDLVAAWTTRLRQLLATGPLTKRLDREISTRYGWLAVIAVVCAARLIRERHSQALGQDCLWITRTVREVGDADRGRLRRARETLAQDAAAWPEFNRALFWFDVAESRRRRQAEKQSVDSVWQVAVFGRDWAFQASDFDYLIVQVGERPLLDDRLIALELAIWVYRENEQPKAWLSSLNSAVVGDAALQTRLNDFLNPVVSPQTLAFQAEQAKWARQNRAHEVKEAARREKWKRWLQTNLGVIRNLGKSPQLPTALWHLHDVAREGRGLSETWSVSDWRRLEPEFGPDVAEAFRDGAMDFWRAGQPSLKSTRPADDDGTPASTIFGITGVNIEALEHPNWTSRLSSADAYVAACYAMNELNGFPPWLAELHHVFPTEVIDVTLKEIDFELASAAGGKSHYILYDVAWCGGFLWDSLGGAILGRLETAKPDPENLVYLLVALNGSSVDDATLAEQAARKALASKHDDLAPIWFAQWCGVDPSAAIPAAAARLANLSSPALQTQFAMKFVTNLVGGRNLGLPFARRNYRTVAYMKALHQLIHQHVRQADDIDRIGKGVFSPGLRDHAQEAREVLQSFIAETPGKEAFLAMMEIATDHPDPASRPWAAYRAKAKAAQDADFSPWDVEQVRAFNDALERTPANHRELWDLAVARLTDFKADLEGGDESQAPILRRATLETEVRNFIASWCRSRAAGRYAIPQEEELADAKRPDLRFHGMGFDGPVPIELKVADNWTGPQLFERLENQLCGDYLRDVRSSRGVYVLVWIGVKKKSWEHPTYGKLIGLKALVTALKDRWRVLSERLPDVEDIEIIGVDLTLRTQAPAASP